MKTKILRVLLFVALSVSTTAIATNPAVTGKPMIAYSCGAFSVALNEAGQKLLTRLFR